MVWYLDKQRENSIHFIGSCKTNEMITNGVLEGT